MGEARALYDERFCRMWRYYLAVSEQAFRHAGHSVFQVDGIVSALRAWADHGAADLAVTTGGTGIAERDVTPEATAAVLERTIPGVAEWIRASGLDKTPYAALGRAAAGIRARTLIVNLPGSPAGVADGLEVLSRVVDHAVELLRGEACHGQGPEGV
jgi:molybdenum cofactor biosynthesis protein B